jgi:hypothetical protein
LLGDLFFTAAIFGLNYLLNRALVPAEGTAHA